MIRSFFHLLAALVASSREFRREWKRAEGDMPPADDVTGRWEGEWESEANGHRGGLRCVMTRIDASHCQAVFHATYSKILRVCYSVELNVSQQEGRFELQGDSDLGKLAGGVYEYRGEATAEGLTCTYRCKYDHGTFRLSRLQ